MPLRRMHLSLSLAALGTFVTGLLVSAVLGGVQARLESRHAQRDFEQRAMQRVDALQQGLTELHDVLAVNQVLLDAVTPLTRQQFRAFALPLLQRYPFVQAFSFQRRITHAERAAFEQGRQTEKAGFTIVDLDRGTPVPAPARAEYVVVDYLEPMASNRAAFGLDASARPVLRAALEQATDSGRASASNLLTLAQDSSGQRGFVLVMPVYRPGQPHATIEQRRAALYGHVGAAIRATDLVQKILHGAGLLDDPRLGLTVYASSQVDPATKIFQDEPVQSAATLERTLAADGRPWHVVINGAPQPLLAQHGGALLVFLIGTLFSAMAAALVQLQAQRARRVQWLVEQRTIDLKHSNRLLNEDIVARKRTERALLDSENRFRRLLALSSDWYWEQDTLFRFTSITGGFVDKAHMPVERFMGLTRWDNHPAMRVEAWGRDHIARLQAHLPFSDLEYATVNRLGQVCWLRVSGEPLFDDKGNFKGYRGTGTDITQRKLAEQRIQHIAHHDVLTGLPNRALLQDRLAQAIAYANRSGQPLWVLLIDLDRFKFINDSLGHKAGDVLLNTVAERLSASLRESDTVARLSGDEFVALLSQHPSEALSSDVVQRLMNTVARPVLLDGKEFQITCSIGIAIYQAEAGGSAPTNLIEHADIAMYAAKKLGRNRFQFFAPAMNADALERLRLEGALRNALERNELVLHYQPQLDLASGRIVGVEALLRWLHPELGMVAPDRFIGLAEETGLIVPIGAWVLRQACAQARLWQQRGYGPLRMAVNLSARQFNDTELVAHIGAALADTGLAPACLELELTESVFMGDATLALTQLHELKALGLLLSIDDFGTGYSSFSYLRRLPIDVLKIDRAFVHDIASDAGDAAIVVSIIALAHNLQLRVIAEGVETEQQLAFLREQGCDEMQGYYFSRPVPAAEIDAMLRDGRGLPAAERPVLRSV